MGGRRLKCRRDEEGVVVGGNIPKVNAFNFLNVLRMPQHKDTHLHSYTNRLQSVAVAVAVAIAVAMLQLQLHWPHHQRPLTPYPPQPQQEQQQQELQQQQQQKEEAVEATAIYGHYCNRQPALLCATPAT